MARIVIYSPADPTVPNRVTAYLLSANTPDFDGEPNKVVNPDLTSVEEVLQKYWKVDTGSVVEMSAGEKTAVDAEIPTISPFPVGVFNKDVEQVNWPMTSDRTPLYNPNIIAPGYLLYVTGAFDDISAPARGVGAQMQFQVTDEGSATAEGRFLEHVYVLGGECGHSGGGYGDWASMELYAGASAPSSTPGAGNANKVPTGYGFNIIVPAPLDDGDYTVDGATLEAGEINQDLVPVPNTSGTGFWNWDPTASPSITPVDPTAPDGSFDLYDAPLPIARQANRVPLLCAGDCCPDTIKGKKILPHWTVKFTAHRAASGTASVAFILKTARAKTT